MKSPVDHVEVLLSRAARDEARRMVQHSRAPRHRTMREFAEQEIVLPTGPEQGSKFRGSTPQPFAGLLLELMDDRRYTFIACTGPTQSGKSLICLVIPMLYTLFELKETIVFGVPDGATFADKWREDIEPVISKTRFAGLMPSVGAGSRGGEPVSAIKFRNGATMRVMTGGGGDQTRSAFTARFAAMTEVDKMDLSGGASREADKVTQIERRTDAFAARGRRIFKECTPSIPTGRIWREIKRGTDTRIAVPCCGCGEWFTPEKDHLMGWQDATTIDEAMEKGRFVCPSCGVMISDAERVDMNNRAVVLHRGQECDKAGNIIGDAPVTDTLGFRWNAFNNLFWRTADIAAREWNLAREPDELNADKDRCQFLWAIPHIPTELDLSGVSIKGIQDRQTEFERCRIPPGVTHLVLGADAGRRLIHWTVAGFTADATTHIIDYGREEVPIDIMTDERAMTLALRNLRDRVSGRYIRTDGSTCSPSLHLLDSGYLTDTVMAFCRESPGWMPVKGQGSAAGVGAGHYRQPTALSKTVRKLGDGYHVTLVRGGPLVLIDVDRWKAWLHSRINTPASLAGSFTVFRVPSVNDHLAFAKHLIAERQVQTFVEGKGNVVKWEVVNANNHWLDGSTYACVAGHLLGARFGTRPVITPMRRVTSGQKSNWLVR